MSNNRDNGLPPREATLFKSIVKHYETKQYKKGVKACDQILKKFAEHGETLAMKGLILNCQERKPEAYELVRKGVKMDMKSHVCWHVYGLLYRSDREYLQAIKAYRSALRHDADNVQILRDLSLLQVQMRDLPGFVQTRQHLLTLKPTNRNNWFTFAVSQHLQGRVSQAIGIVEAYERTLEGSPENDYEHGEMLLYKNMLLEEDGQLQAALDHLDKHKSEIVDVLCWLEKRAQLLRELGRHDEAEPIYRQLLKRNPEHCAYHAGIQACVLKSTPVEHWLDVPCNAEAEAALKALYAELQHTFPKSTVCRRLPLDFARDPDHFRVAAKTYLLPPLRKGVPSLFADIKPLYADASKAAALGDIFGDWLSTLEADGILRGEKVAELPTVIMWVRALYAQHLDMTGETLKALRILDQAIKHTPTLLDLAMFKARVFKHGGALSDASDTMDAARQLDLQDRYLNTKATRYLLRADNVDEAQKVIGLFTKDGDNHSNLYDMQCMWYALEVARSHLRQGEYGKALKNFVAVDKHFNDIVEDQFDFHTYCIRKMTLRAYVRMLRLEDGIFGHHFWVEAAHGACETYLALVDKPAKAKAAEEAEASDEMSAAERKKAESKRKKAEAKAKAEAEAAAKVAGSAKGEGGGGGGGKKKGAVKERPVDEDPDGAALAGVDNPLEKASGFLRTMQTHAPRDVRTHTLACEIAMRKKKYLLVLRALRKAHALAADAPDVHKCTVRFLHAVGSESGLDGTIAKVIEANREHLGAKAGESLSAYVDAYLQRTQGAAPSVRAAAVLAAAEMRLLIEPSERDEALKLVCGLEVTGMSLPIAMETHALLASAFKDEAAAAAFKARAVLAFPVCTYFGGKAPPIEEHWSAAPLTPIAGEATAQAA